MTTEYMFKVKADKEGQPAVHVFFRVERAMLCSRSELAQLQNQLQERFDGIEPDKIPKWRTMLESMTGMLDRLRNVPLSTVVGLQSGWAPVEDRFAEQMLQRFDSLTNDFIKIAVDGSYPNQNIVFNIGNYERREPLPGTQAAAAVKELSELQQFLITCENENKPAASTADALKAAVEVGKTTTAVTKCCVDIAITAAKYLGRQWGPALKSTIEVVKSCSSAAQSVVNLGENSKPTSSPEQKSQAEGECGKYHESPSPDRGTGKGGPNSKREYLNPN
jgi:hypothetical protein